jgi:transcriptional regulator with XRE-family HTH domain
MEVKSIGSNIKALREKRNLTQTELADKIGMTRGMIQKIESNKTVLTITTFISICHALKYSPNSILNGIIENK